MNFILAIFYLLSFVFTGPSLGSNSKDTEIKNNAAYMLGAAHEFMNNNNGRIPTTAELEQVITQGVHSDYPAGDYHMSGSYFPNLGCDGSQSARAMSIKVTLTDGSEYCVD